MSRGKSKKQSTESYEIKIPTDIMESIESEAKDVNIKIDKVLENMINNGYAAAFYDVGESAILRYVAPWKDTPTKISMTEDGEETAENLKVYRRLREEFPPVSAGIDYIRAFTSGSGINIKIENPTNNHQREAKKIIEEFKRNVFMDDTTIGLETIIDIMTDDALTEGVAAAEIVYSGWIEEGFKFEDWITPTGESKEGKPLYMPKDMTDDDWKKLGGIIQLKIIPSAYTRLKPYRDINSWRVLYYTLDEGIEKEDKKAIKLLPWQVFWLSPNRRNQRMKGVSVIKPVASSALLLERLFNDIGLSIDRWADKKFFFILGDTKSGRSWAPPAVRNFMKDVEKMSAENKSGIPVPAGFDIKTIGGEVYDGGDFIDKLISFICGALKYPRSFFEQGGIQLDDKIWLTWHLSYGRQQAQLKKNIENQLFAKQIYCILGTKIRIPKQGVSTDKQEYADTYIPELEWSSEGRWDRENKLNMLKAWLNAANPITPVLKIEIEEDAARTLGYSDVVFDSVREQTSLQMQINMIEKKIDLLKSNMELELLEKTYKAKDFLDLIPTLTFGRPEVPEEPISVIKPKIPLTPEKELERRLMKRQEGGVSIKKIPVGKVGEELKEVGSTRIPKT